MTDDGYAEYTSDDKANAAIYANQFDHYVSKIKEEAIEAYVRDYVKRLYGDFTETDSAYVVTVHQVGNLADARPSPGAEPGTTKIVYSKPTASGHKDCEVTVDGVREYSEDLQVQWIRDKVDEWFDRWRGLPDPGRIATVAEAVKDVAVQLGDDAGPFGAEGTVQHWIRTLHDATDDTETFSGGAVNNFKANFVEPLPNIARSYCEMGICLATAVAGQKRMWDGVRAQIGEALTAVWWMFVEVKTGGSAQYNSMIRTFKYVRSALDFVPQGYNIFVDELSISAIKATSFADDAKIDLSPSTFWDAWDQVGPMLDKIEQSIFDAEKQILDGMCHALDIVGGASRRTMFDLNTGTRYVPGHDKRLTQAIALEYQPGDRLAMYDTVVDQLCNETTGILPKLNAYFSTYGSILIGQLDEIAASVCRDSRIGLGRYGPSEAVQDFARNLGNLLEELAGECTDTATNVRAVYNLYMQADADAIAALNAIVSKLNTEADTWGGTPYQTWDYDTRELGRLSDIPEEPHWRRGGPR